MAISDDFFTDILQGTRFGNQQGHVAGTEHLRLLAYDHFSSQLEEFESRYASALPSGWSEHPGYREIALWPSTFSRSNFSRDQLLEAVRASGLLSWAPSLSVTADGYEGEYEDNEREGTAIYANWNVRRSGLLYLRSALSEDLTCGKRGNFVSVDATVEAVTDAVDMAGRYYEWLVGRDDSVTVRVRMTGTEGRDVTPRPADGANDGSCRLSEVTYEAVLPVFDLRDRRGSVVTQIARDLLQQCNWPDPPARTIRSLADTHLTRAIYRRYGHQ